MRSRLDTPESNVSVALLETGMCRAGLAATCLFERFLSRLGGFSPISRVQHQKVTPKSKGSNCCYRARVPLLHSFPTETLHEATQEKVNKHDKAREVEKAYRAVKEMVLQRVASHESRADFNPKGLHPCRAIGLQKYTGLSATWQEDKHPQWAVAAALYPDHPCSVRVRKPRSEMVGLGLSCLQTGVASDF